MGWSCKWRVLVIAPIRQLEKCPYESFVLITVTVIMAPIVEELILEGSLMGRVF